MDLDRAVEEFSAVTGVTRRDGNTLLLDDARNMIWAEYRWCSEQSRMSGERQTATRRYELMALAVHRVTDWFLQGEGGYVARLAIDAHYLANHRQQHTWAILAGIEWRRSNEQAKAGQAQEI